MNWKLAGMASTALATVALTGVSLAAAPSRITGDISLALGQSWEDDDIPGPIQLFDDSFTSLTGDARVNIAFGGDWNLQLNFKGVGAFTDDNGFLTFDREASFQGEADFYWRSDHWAFGPFVGGGIASGPDLIVASPSAEYYFVGVQAQHYWETFTLGVGGGFLGSSNDTSFLIASDELFLNDAWFVRGEARWYCSPKFSLTANAGYISGEALSGIVPGFNIDVNTVHWGAKAEYWPDQNEGLSLWVGYEGRSTDYDFPGAITDREKDVHTAKIGVTFHFGVDEHNARANDRDGPAWNTMDYGDIVVGG